MRQTSIPSVGLEKLASSCLPSFNLAMLSRTSSPVVSRRPVPSSEFLFPAWWLGSAINYKGFGRAGDLMQDLKTGHLLRASPRAQFYGQLIGSAVSIVVTTTAYNLYTRAYPIPGPSFPAPTAYVWLSLARLLRKLPAFLPRVRQTHLRSDRERASS